MDLLDANDAPLAHPASWYAATARIPEPRPALDGDTRCHVCIVGAGYTGLSAALTLAEAGADVVVLDAQRVGFGASGRNGGQVGSGQRVDQITLEARLGRDRARALWDIAEAAKSRVRAIVEAHAPEARWTPGVAEVERSLEATAHLHRLAEHLAERYAYDRIELLDRHATAALTGSARFAGGALDHGAGHLHPLRLALGMARAAEAAGARIHEGTRATGLEEGRRPVVVTDRGRVAADHAILAGNGYLGRLEPRVSAHVMPINNFVVATEPLGPAMPLARDVAVADGDFVVSYWRRSEDGRLLFGGGESYGYRFPGDIRALVRKPLLCVYPQLADARITHAWGGTLAVTTGRLPHLARLSPRVLSAGGYSGHGVSMATMAGAILAEAILGRPGRLDAMAAVPQRAFPGAGRARAPLLALAMTWYAMRDRLGL
jgi:gamma-glutamylputrescine oxidase